MLRFLGRPRGTDHLMAMVDELGDQPWCRSFPVAPATNTRIVSLRLVTSPASLGSTAMNTPTIGCAPMDEREFLAEQFEEHRTRLRAVAYRCSARVSEADDAVQETWLPQPGRLGTRWRTSAMADDRGRKRFAEHVASRRSRHEEPLDVRMPEPIIDRADGTDPEHEALLSRLRRPGPLVVLETLNPGRAARVRPAHRGPHENRPDRRPT